MDYLNVNKQIRPLMDVIVSPNLSPRVDRFDEDERRFDEFIHSGCDTQLWQNYTERVQQIEADLYDEMAYYEQNPERHPKFEIEWKIYLSERIDDLIRNGEDPRMYNIKDEFFAFWQIKLREMFNNIFQKEKAQLRQEIEFLHRKSLDNTWLQNEFVDYNQLQDYKKPTTNKRDNGSISYKNKYSSSDQSNKRIKANHGIEESVDLTSDVSVIHVLRQLSVLETHLGSLGPKVVDLLSQAILLEKSSRADSVLSIQENCLMLETVKEKLIGLLQAKMIKPSMIGVTDTAILNITNLLQKVPSGKDNHNDKPSFSGIRSYDEKPNLDEKKIQLDKKKSHLDERKPYQDERKPPTDERKSYQNERNPYLDERRPQLNERKPQADEIRPQSDERKPQIDERKPQIDERRPQSDERKPQTDERNSYLHERRPQADERQFYQDKRDSYFDERRPLSDERNSYPHERRPQSDERKPQPDEKLFYQDVRNSYLGERRPQSDERNSYFYERRPQSDERQFYQDKSNSYLDERRPQSDERIPYQDARKTYEDERTLPLNFLQENSFRDKSIPQSKRTYKVSEINNFIQNLGFLSQVSYQEKAAMGQEIASSLLLRRQTDITEDDLLVMINTYKTNKQEPTDAFFGKQSTDVYQQKLNEYNKFSSAADISSKTSSAIPSLLDIPTFGVLDDLFRANQSSHSSYGQEIKKSYFPGGDHNSSGTVSYSFNRNPYQSDSYKKY